MAQNMFDLAEPIPFIQLGKDNKFVINEDACKLLSSITDNIGVLAIAGMYRTGKSFILNQMVNKTGGFNIGSTIEPCTQGIWLWGCAPQGFGKDFKMVMLDTEGLGSYSQNETYDVQIFSLAVLLSSYFIYNSLGNIDETALDRLSLVVELTKHIKAQSEGETEDAYQLRMFFPAFMWLVRDFSLELTAGGQNISPNEYLERALEPAKGDNKRVAAKNAIRQCITDFFKKRDCFVLKRPVNDEKVLQNLAQAKETDFRPEYLEAVKDLKKLIFDQVKPKKLYGNSLNGAMLVELARNYVKSINDGSIPVIRTAWENVVEIECGKAVQSGIKLYSEKMQEVITQKEILEEDEFEKLHRDCESAAVELFIKKVVGDDVTRFREELKDGIYSEYGKYKESNKVKSATDSEELIANLIKHLADSIAANELDDMDKLGIEWSRIVDNFKQVSRGPMKWTIVAKTLQSVPLDNARKVTNVILTKLKAEFDKKQKEFTEKANSDYARLETMYKSVDGEWKRQQDQNKILTETVNENTKRMAEFQKQNGALNDKYSALERERDTLQSENKSIKEQLSNIQGKAKDFDKVNEENLVLQNKLKGQKKSKCIVM